jgi:hypothetical protein
MRLQLTDARLVRTGDGDVVPGELDAAPAIPHDCVPHRGLSRSLGWPWARPTNNHGDRKVSFSFQMDRFCFACASHSAVTMMTAVQGFVVRARLFATTSRFNAGAPLTSPPRIRARALLILPFTNNSGLFSTLLVTLRLFCPASLLRHPLDHLPCFWLHPLYTQPSTAD